MSITKPMYLLAKGWRLQDNEWHDPLGLWPDPLTVDEAAKIQWAREYEEANGHLIQAQGAAHV